jgi:hypothetical protein
MHVSRRGNVFVTARRTLYNSQNLTEGKQSDMSKHALSLSPVAERLLGAWRLVSWEATDSDGQLTYPLGRDAVGQLSYDQEGRMSAQLMRRNQAHFASEDWRQATTEERASAWIGYFGYFGTYEIDEAAGAVVHLIEGSWFPNLVGKKELRHYRFEGELLVLDADTDWGRVRIIWGKASADETPSSNPFLKRKK